jgi:hypothetical protein
MERPNRGAGLRLNRPSGPVLREFEQKTPVTRSPAEKWFPSAASGVPEIVLAFGDARQELCPFPASKQFRTWVRRFWKISYCVPRSPERFLPFVISLWREMRCAREGELRAVTRAD